MGNDPSRRLTCDEVEDLARQTAFSAAEIRDWSRRFYECSPTGQMTKSEFLKLYATVFPNGDPKRFAGHVFRLYDNDSNGYIDFREFLCSLSITSRGSIDDKLRWAFTLYDLDGNGYVSKKEVFDIFTAIFNMRGGDLGVPRSDLTPKQAVDRMFNDLDKNGDDRLSELEFLVGAKSSPLILSLLGSVCIQEDQDQQ